MKRGKKYVEAAKNIDRQTLYEATEAVSLVKKSAVAKFDETIEAHIRTGCDGRHADQQIRGAVVLPHGTGKQVRVLVFAKGAKADEAVAAGAEFVGAEELIPRIQNDVIDEIKAQMMKNGAVNAMMSGSGPTVFGIFDDPDKAEFARDQLKISGLSKQTFLTTVSKPGGTKYGKK